MIQQKNGLKILEDGYFDANKNEDVNIDKAMEFYSEREILFFEPIENILYPNNRLYAKGMELILQERFDLKSFQKL